MFPSKLKYLSSTQLKFLIQEITLIIGLFSGLRSSEFSSNVYIYIPSCYNFQYLGSYIKFGSSSKWKSRISILIKFPKTKKQRDLSYYD